jgi:hypothetical protein
LRRAGIPHAIIGGVAVCMHGYQRNTVDVDLLISAGRYAGVRGTLEDAGYTWSADKAEFHSPRGIPVVLTAADRARPGSDVRLPDPADESTVKQIEGLPVLYLAKLIESKIACSEASLRRTHKDFADVVELIAKHDLNRSFARHLHKSVRAAFRQLVGQAKAE